MRRLSFKYAVLWVLGAAMLVAAPAQAQAVTAQRIQAAIDQFVRAELETQNSAPLVLHLPNPDPRLRLPDCARLSVQWSAPPRGRSSERVAVSCAGEAGWRLIFPVAIARKRWVVVAARPMVPRSLIGETDVLLEARETPEGGSAWLDRVDLVVGQELRASLHAGQALSAQMLLPPKVIKSGEGVSITVSGTAFSIHSEGVALMDARLGEVVRLRMPSGRVISAVAREPGRAELQP